MSISEDIKREASLPVQSRVDTKVLASLLRYWEGEGQYIRTMSQLLSWSMDLLFEILSRNNRLNTIYDSFAEADDYLIDRGLYQPGIGKRGRRKASSARKFESMRIEGIDPKSTDPSAFNSVHNKHGVNVSNMGNTVDTPEDTAERGYNKDQIEFLKIMAEIDRKKKMNDEADARYEAMKASGAIKYDESGLIIQESRSDTSVEQVNKWRKDDSLYESSIDSEPEVKTKVSRKDELARPLTSEELERREIERERKDREQLEAFKNM